ncbi:MULTISPECIES: hypothetical protein [unclassified Blautia]
MFRRSNCSGGDLYDTSLHM